MEAGSIEDYTTQADRMDRYLSVLASRDRREIVGTLARVRCALPLSEFHGNRQGLRQEMHYHLKALERAGLVVTWREGRNTMAALERDDLDRLLPGLVDRLAEYYRP